MKTSLSTDGMVSIEHACSAYYGRPGSKRKLIINFSIQSPRPLTKFACYGVQYNIYRSGFYSTHDVSLFCR